MELESKENRSNAASLDIGVRLKHARMVRGLRLIDVAQSVGCSESLLSKIENGRTNPSINMLHRIVESLGANIAQLFAPSEEPGGVVQRRGTRPVLETDQLRKGEGIEVERLIPYAEGYLLQGNIHIVAPGGQSEGSITHSGEEVGYVLSGMLELTVDGRVYTLAPGDSFHFKSRLPHAYRNPSTVETRVLWINTPPTY